MRSALWHAFLIMAVGMSSACTPDVTRQRVENDVALTYAAAHVRSEKLRGRPAVSPHVLSAECHVAKTSDKDAGAGAWTCDLAVAVERRRRWVTLALIVDTLGCYQAVDPAHRDRSIRKIRSGERVPDPRVGFDGCFDVRDGRTSTDNEPGVPVPS